MKGKVLFIQGGGDDGYEADKKLVNSLRTALGESYNVEYPQMPVDLNLPDFGWMSRIGKEISMVKNKIIIVGHSFGASMILKYLSENQVPNLISGIFLIATPLWCGDEDWKQGLKLEPAFADKIPRHIPIFLYHCMDDEVVSLDDLEFYRQNLPHATIRILRAGGHQFNNDLSEVAKDIRLL